MSNTLEQSSEEIVSIPPEDIILSETLVETIFSDPNVQRHEEEFRTLLAIKEDIIFEITDFLHERTASFSLGMKGEELYVRAAIQRWLQAVLEKRIAQLEHYMEGEVIWNELMSMGIGPSTTAKEIQEHIDALVIRLKGLDKKNDGLEIKKVHSKLVQLRKRLEKVSVDTPKRQGILKGLQEMLYICRSAKPGDVIENDTRLSELKINLPEWYLALHAQEQLIAFKKLSISRKTITVPTRGLSLDIVPVEEKTTDPQVSKYAKKVQGLILASLIAVPIAIGLMDRTGPISPISMPLPEKNPSLLGDTEIRKLADQVKCATLQKCFEDSIKLLISNSPQDPFNGDTEFISQNYAKIMIPVLNKNKLFQKGLINHLNIKSLDGGIEFSTSDFQKNEWATTFIKRSRREKIILQLFRHSTPNG